MNLKRLLILPVLGLAVSLLAADPVGTTTAPTVKIYGFVANEFYYNSRQNVEMVDGIINLFPKPVVMKDGVNIDVNATPQAEMLSVNSRLGFDIAGAPILGAKSSGKIEADFAGFGTTYYVLRIRQAYAKLNWKKTELLLGQTWHPLFGSVAPTTPSANTGAPFQPFNRSPQLRVKYSFTKDLSATAAAIYEMQYASQGPLGTSNIYMKNAMIPNGFIGIERKTENGISGIGVDAKVIKPITNSHLLSTSAVAYTQLTNDKLTVKAKVIYGQNLSDQLMIGGYGVSKFDSDQPEFTNFKNGTCWLNAIYGSKLQAGVLIGISKNFGTNKDLATYGSGYVVYGYGSSNDTRTTIIDRLTRIAPHVSYNLPNLKLALEYDFTTASYGFINEKGLTDNPDNVNNHRISASVCYIF